MPPLLATAKANADIHLIENDADVEQLESQEGWEILPIQGKYIGLHTALLDEKAQAINIISIYASILGEDFYPYVEDVVKDVILPLFTFSTMTLSDSLLYRPFHLSSHRLKRLS